MEKLSLILPNIRSCHNVGAMFRTADATGFEKLYLVGYTAHPPKVQIDKVSLGAETWVPWEAKEDLPQLIEELKNGGISVIALEKTDSSEDINTVDFKAPIALIVGNEVDGLDLETLKKVDKVVHIPMRGKKESLNVSVAGGIAMDTIARQVLV